MNEIFIRQGCRIAVVRWRRVLNIRKYKKVRQLVPQGPERQATWEEHMEFVGEVRGWRTILARLIRAGIIGQAAAEKEFEVYKGRDSKNWQTLVN